MTDYDELARQAEAGKLIPKGNALRGSDAAAHGRQLLMDATGADSLAAAVTMARGRPRLDAPVSADITWKVRTTAVLDREVRQVAAARGVSMSQ
ncbi:MAG: ribbon-helix-helix protein, CopG family, partial [Rhodoglobus sp.]